MTGVFEKVSTFRKLVKTIFQELDDSALIEMLREVSTWHYSRKGILSQDHLKLYELMMNNSYNPNTTYKWFLLTRSPFELREKLKLNLISQREAFAVKKQLNTLASTSQQELLTDIIKCVERYIVR